MQLHSRLTETGTFDLWCHEVDSDRRWRLQFDVRSTTQTDIQAHAGSGESAGVIDEATWEKCHERIRRVFSADTADSPAGLVKRLAKVLGLYRNQWPPSLLRRMWEALLHLEAGRRISEDHEARWLNLTGYSLRPGFGVAIDDWRVVETWRTVRNKLVHHGPSIRNESLILWRRISGGLTAGQQTAIAEPLLSAIRATYGSSSARRSLSTTFRPSESIEVWRVLGSLEWLNLTTKIELGDLLCELLTRPKLAVAHSAMAWALGRLGQRATMYGPLNTVVPGETAENWLQHVLQLQRPDAIYNLAVMQLARKTNDRYRDLSDSARRDATRWLQEQQAASHLIELVREGGRLDREEQGQIFGESLPTGLRLRQAG